MGVKYFLLFFFAFSGNVALANPDFSEILDYFDLKTPIDIRTSALKKTKCYEDVKKYFNDLSKGQNWAQLMLDASEKFPVGILSENRILYGDFEQCINIKSPYDFIGQYCLLSINSTSGIFEKAKISNKRYPKYLAGHCIPSSCRLDYLNQVIQDAYIPFNDKNVSEYISIVIEPGNCQTKNQEVPYSTLNYFTISVIIVLLLLVAFSTIYDGVYEKTDKKEMTIMTAFSLIRNGMPLFFENESLSGISGIRALAAIVILYTHFKNFALNGDLSNLKAARVFANQDVSGYMVHANYYVFVDIFLVLGGIMAMRSFLSELYGQNTYNPVFSIIKRYFRIMTPIAFIFLLRVGLADHFHVGPAYNEFNNFYGRGCLPSMTSLLLGYDNFKTNLYEMCFNQLWYIHVDLQLFVLSQLIFLFGIWKPKALIKLTIFCCLANSLLEFFVAYTNNLGYSIYCDRENRSMLLNYALPHLRGVPYFEGLFFGCLIHKYEKTSLSKRVKSMMWIWALLITCFSLYLILYTDCDNYSQTSSALLFVYGRLLFTSGIGVLMFSCFLQKYDLFSKIISIPPLPFIGEISYEIFLIQVPFIQYYVATSRETIYITRWQTISYAMSILTISTALGVIINLLITRPSKILVQSLRRHWMFATIRPHNMSQINNGKYI